MVDPDSRQLLATERWIDAAEGKTEEGWRENQTCLAMSQ